MVPPGPLRETSAESPDVASARGALTFGFLFVGAISTGVDVVGMIAFVAASAFVEKGQNALTRSGKSIAANTTTANQSMKKCWLDLMGN